MGHNEGTNEQSTAQHKKCRTCKELKPVTDFNPSCAKNGNWQCKICRKVRDAVHYQKNRTKIIIRVTTYNTEHAEERREYLKRNQNSSYRVAYRLQHVEQRKQAITRYFRTSKGKAAKQKVMSKRYAALKGSIIFEDVNLTDIYIRDEGICQLCLTTATPEEATIDHKTPLSRKGQHTWDNTQLAHMLCNSRKGNKTMEEWNNQRRHWDEKQAKEKA